MTDAQRNRDVKIVRSIARAKPGDSPLRLDLNFEEAFREFYRFPPETNVETSSSMLFHGSGLGSMAAALRAILG